MLPDSSLGLHNCAIVKLSCVSVCACLAGNVGDKCLGNYNIAAKSSAVNEFQPKIKTLTLKTLLFLFSFP